MGGSGGSVYPPREDTYLLLPFARGPRGTRVLEVGCGSGLAAVEAARAGARVVATDLNPEALRRLRAVASAERLRIDLVRTDLARGLGRFDWILANPPYLPTRPEERDPDRWENLALDGGPDGLSVTRRLLAALPDHLTMDGRAFVVVSDLSPARAREQVRRAWRARGGTLAEVAERSVGGERLVVWELHLGGRRPTSARRRSPRTSAPRRGTGARPRVRVTSRRVTSRATGRGRNVVRGGASTRRRSPRGS